MPILPRLRPHVADDTSAEPSKAVPVAQDAEIQAAPADMPAGDVDEKPVVPDGGAQRGVQKIEAVTLSWNKLQLAGLLIKYVPRPSPSSMVVVLALTVSSAASGSFS